MKNVLGTVTRIVRVHHYLLHKGCSTTAESQSHLHNAIHTQSTCLVLTATHYPRPTTSEPFACTSRPIFSVR